MISGYADGTLGVNDNIKRQDIAVICYRVMNALGIDTEDYSADDFSDHSDISEYAVDAVYCLKQTGIINGRDNNEFAPLENSTRAEVAVMVYSLLRLKNGGLISG